MHSVSLRLKWEALRAVFSTLLQMRFPLDTRKLWPQESYVMGRAGRKDKILWNRMNQMPPKCYRPKWLKTKQFTFIVPERRLPAK